jgi:hypothetical protein
MKWTIEEIKFLKRNYAVKSREELEAKLNRNWSSIISKAKFLRLSRGCFKNWTSEELEMLKAMYPQEKNDVLSKIFSCSYAQVYHKAKKLGLKKSAEFSQKTREENNQNLIEGGASTRFQKGGTSWNKGKKTGGGPKEHRFKKGHLPHNTKSDGDITIRKDRRGIPYAFIRVSSGEWVHLHRYVWELAHGEIEKGTVIRFVDGNTLNCNIENLEAIGKDENMKRNTIHRFPGELKEAIYKLSRLKRIIKKKENAESIIRFE